MARARNSGGSGSVWGMVILGILFFVCLVLSITFYVQLQGAVEAAEDADSELNRFADRGLRNDPVVLDLLDARDPVVGQLIDRNTRLRGLIGDSVALDDLADEEAMEPLFEDGVRASVADAVSEHGSLLAAVAALRGEVESREQRIARLDQERQAALDRADEIEQRLDEVRAEYTAVQEQLQARLEEVTAQFTGYQQQSSGAEAELRELVATARQEQEARVRELDDEITRLELERDGLRREIRELARREDRVDSPDVVRPGGRIVSVVDADRRAQVDIGRQDRLVLGMTFEVFDRDELVRHEGGSRLRGKATIEIIDLRDASAMARIVRRSPGVELRPGDQIVNLVYDPEATYRFFVDGEFDLDRDGRSTEAERQRVQQMIRDWGGEVASELRYDVDFLVLGSAPDRPADLPPGAPDRETIQRHTEALRLYERYQELEEEARAFGVPVLNQNRFLALVGYYQR